METVEIPVLTCTRCEHRWISRLPAGASPRACARCHSPYWHLPRQEHKRKPGRPTLYPWLPGMDIGTEVAIPHNEAGDRAPLNVIRRAVEAYARRHGWHGYSRWTGTGITFRRHDGTERCPFNAFQWPSAHAEAAVVAVVVQTAPAGQDEPLEASQPEAVDTAGAAG